MEMFRRRFLFFTWGFIFATCIDLLIVCVKWNTTANCNGVTTCVTNPKPLVIAAKQNLQKVTHVRFLKVHKAGSTTMQNLFFRFGVRYGLNIVLASGRGPFLRNTNDILKLPPGQHYHIFALHTVYSKGHFEKIISNNTSVNIGIVRYPPDRLISAAYYHRDVFHVTYLTKIPRDNYIHNLVNYPDVYDKRAFSQTRNQMGREFGFSPKYRYTDIAKIRKHLQRLNEEFKLVLVMERFDESLVLMKRLLYWDTIDILYHKANSHQHEQNHLNSSEIAKVKKTCFLDFALYDFFTEIFQKKVEDQGLDFKEEVDDFKRLMTRVALFCGEGQRRDLRIEKSRWYEEFVFMREECDLMKMRELKFIEYLKLRHSQMNILNS